MTTSAPNTCTHRRWAAGAVLTGTVVLTLTACGSDDDESPSATASAGSGATVTDTVTPTPAPSSPGTDADAAPAPGGSAGDGSGGGDATDSRCHTSELEVTLAGGDAGAGSLYLTLDFRNISDRDCTVSGYPGVSLVGDDNGTRIGAPAERDGSGSGGGPVPLSPGASAVAQLQVTQPENYGDRCTVTAADGLRIYPPDELDATYVAAPNLRGCLNDDLSILRIRALSPA